MRADRAVTVDTDAFLKPAEPVLAAAAAIAARRGWHTGWLNDAAGVFVPSGYGDRLAVWRTVHDDGYVRIEVGDFGTLLAMELHAANRRGNRDGPDLAVLLPACGITTVDAATELYEAYYPGDSLTVRSEGLLAALLDIGTPAPAALSVPPLSR